MQGGYFTNSEQYKLRKAFVCFLSSILNPKISFEDLHSKNIMYDELESRWEIVDGYIYEQEDKLQKSDEQPLIEENKVKDHRKLNSSIKTVENALTPKDSSSSFNAEKIPFNISYSDNITELLDYSNLNLSSDKIIQCVFGKLSKLARKGLSYNKDMDQKLLKKITLLNK